jgi:hypothetical protein
MIPLSQCRSSNHLILPRPISGDYVGLERMESLSPEDPLTLWYHENTLFIRNNEVVVDKQPVTVRNGTKTYSVSDGGFLVFRGRLFSTKDGSYIALRLIDSDYVAFLVGPKECEPYSRITVFPIKIGNGTLEFDGVQYKPQNVSAEMTKIWTKTLAEQSVEYNGKRHYRDPNAQSCPVPPEFKSY